MNENKELLEDINSTLDELITNADIIKKAKTANELDLEIAALEKTQESLLARLLHRQTQLESEGKKKMVESIRKETIEKKVIDYVSHLKRPSPRLKSKNQKLARRRKARSKSSG